MAALKFAFEVIGKGEVGSFIVPGAVGMTGAV